MADGLNGLAEPDAHALDRGRYTRVAMWLHWLIALAIIFNLSLGYFMEGFPQPLRGIVIGLHVSSGLSVLILTAVRVLWRLTHKPPPELPMQRWEQHLAHIVHCLLYVAMILMPLTGWAIVSSHPPAGSAGWTAAKAAGVAHMPAAPSPQALAAAKPGEGVPGTTRMWGIPLPLIRPVERVGITPGGIAAQNELHDDFVAWHGTGGFILIGLLLLHVLGALKHQYGDREPELQRMGIGRRPA